MNCARFMFWVDTFIALTFCALILAGLVLWLGAGCSSAPFASPSRAVQVAGSQPATIDQSLAGIRADLKTLAEFEVGLHAEVAGVKGDVAGIQAHVTKSYGDNDRWALRLAILGCIVLPAVAWLLPSPLKRNGKSYQNGAISTGTGPLCERSRPARERPTGRRGRIWGRGG